MASQYSSKHGTVSRPPYELYLLFSDMRNFLNMLPEGTVLTFALVGNQSCRRIRNRV